MSKAMYAVMKTAPGEGNVELREIPQPGPPPSGHVTIAVQAAGICGTDLHIFHDEFPSRPPVVLGHEVAGRVAALGDAVTNVQLGDRVTTETYAVTCGACRWCRSGKPNLCPGRRSIGSGVDGGFTNYVVVPAQNVHRLPDGLTYRAGALTEPLACVVHGALELPHLVPGDAAVIAGPGAIGLLTLQVVRAAGARAVMLGTEADAHRLALAADLGAERTLVVGHDDPLPVVHGMTDGAGADLVYECSGAGPAALGLLSLVRRGGQYAQIGLFGRPVAFDLDQVCLKELRVTGSNASIPTSWARALQLLASGQVRPEPLISAVYPVTAWHEAFDLFESRAGLKILLEPV